VAKILELVWKAPAETSLIHLVGGSGCRKTSTLRSVAKEIQKQSTGIAVRFFESFRSKLPGPEPALLATFLYETLVQRPDLFSRIQYYVKHFSREQLGVGRYLWLLVYALLKLNIVKFVILIDDFDSWSTSSVALFASLQGLALSAESSCKFVVSSESRDMALAGPEDKMVELEKGQHRSLVLQSRYSDLFRTRPSLEAYKAQICGKILETEPSAFTSYLILKVLSRLDTISTPSALLRHLSIMLFDPRTIYDYFVQDLFSKPPETVSWSFAALSWIFRGFRPLQENEIGCAAAIAFHLGAASTLNESISMDAFGDLDRYVGIFIRKENDSILPFHESTRKFLLSTPILPDGTRLRTDTELAKLSLKYISDFILDAFPMKFEPADGLPTLVFPSKPEQQFLHYTCRFWPDHYLRANKTIDEDAADDLDQSVLTFLGNAPVRQAWYEVYKAHLPPLSRPKHYELTPLRISCDLGLARIARQIISDSQAILDISELDSSLDLAMKSNQSAIVDCLLDHKAKGHLALGYAAQVGDCSLIERIAGNGADIDAIGELGSTPLHAAVKVGSLGACKTLLRLGASMGKPDGNGNSVLHLACEGGYSSVVKWIMEAKVPIPVNQKNRLDETPLHLAAAFGRVEVVQQLIAKNTDVTPRDKSDHSPLDLACENGHIRVMEYLMDRSHPGMKPFQFAAQSGCVLTLKTVTADNANAGNILRKENALFLAASNGKENAVDYLLQCGADPNKPDEESADKMTPLAKAASKGFIRVIRRLVVASADVNLLSGKNNAAPLHHAASQDQLEAVSELLMVKNCNVNAKNSKKETPLHVSVSAPRIVEVLLRERADQGIRDQDGSTPLHVAAKEGFKESVKLLIERGADVTSMDENGYMALHLAAEEGHRSVVELMISNENVRIDAKSRSGMTALHVAARKGRLEVAKFLVSKSLELVDAKRKDEKSASHLAARKSQLSIVNFLSSKALKFLNATANDGQTALHFAAFSHQPEIVELLLESEASPDLVDEHGRSPLHNASRPGNSRVVKLLLDATTDLNRQDERGRTPVFLAAYRGAADIVRQLVEHGAEVWRKDSDGWSPLHAAFDYKETTEYLISCKKVGVNDKAKSGCTALMIAAKSGYPFVVEALIKAGARLDEDDNDGLTALHYAVGNAKNLEPLLCNNADIHQLDNGGRTCLEYAAETEDLESLNILLGTEGAPRGSEKLDWTDDELLEALFAASESGNFNGAMLLVERDRTMLNRRLRDGCTAMERALKHGRGETALQLLGEGGDPWICGGPYISSIHLASYSNDNEFISAAIPKPASPTPQNAFTYLRLALEFEDEELWNKFQDYRKDTLSITDSDGWTLDSFLLQAQNPFGIKDLGESSGEGQAAASAPNYRPNAMTVPEAWEFERTGDDTSVIIHAEGLEVQPSGKLKTQKYPIPSSSFLTWVLRLFQSGFTASEPPISATWSKN
jgi:ankyrin repeat protein